MIEGISHLTFIVKDLKRAARFFEDVLDAQEVYSSEDKTYSLGKEKFYIICGQWIAVMEESTKRTPSERTYDHIAFKISDDEYDDYLQRICSLGLEIKDSRPRVEGEGRSVYFYDHDNHLFELHTGTLSERLNRYIRA